MEGMHYHTGVDQGVNVGSGSGSGSGTGLGC